MRRKPGALVPLEMAICEAAADLRLRGIARFHGYQLAKVMADAADARLLTAYGTLYRALGRLEKMGLLASEWEDPRLAAEESRPGRRLYRLTGLGETTVAAARKAAPRIAAARKAKKGLAPA